MSDQQNLNHYFMSAMKATDDGNGSYNFFYRTMSAPADKSPQDVFGEALKDIKEEMADNPGRYDNVQIVAFNRI